MSVSLFVILSRNSPRDAGMNFQVLPGLKTEAVLNAHAHFIFHFGSGFKSN